MFTVLSVNIRSGKNKKEELKIYFEEEKADVILLQETWQKEEDNLPVIRGYDKIEARRRKKIGGGVAIYARKCLRIRRIKSSPGKIEYVKGRILFNREKISIISLYIPPKSTQGEMLTLRELDINEEKTCIIGGDFNIGLKSTKEDVKRRKILLEEWTTEENLERHAPDEKTSKKGIIDYFLVKGIQVQKCAAKTPLIETDHKGVTIQLVTRRRRGDPLPKEIRRRNYKHLCEIDYMLDLKKWNGGKPPDDVNLHYDWIVKNTTKSLDDVCPKKKKKFARSGVPWWTPEIKALLYKRNKLRRGLKCEVRLRELKDCRKKIKRKIHDAKQSFWEDENKKKNVDDLHKIIKSWKKSQEGEKKYLLGLLDGEKKVEDEMSIANLLIGYYASVGTDNEERRKVPDEKKVEGDEPHAKNNKRRTSPDEKKVDGAKPHANKRIDAEIANLMNKPISRNEVSRMFDEIKKNKAAGDDDLRPFDLKRGNEEMMKTLLVLYNKCWKRSEYPTKWNTGKIVCIPKKKEEYLNVSEFRPIQLLNIAARGFEKIILRRIQRINEKLRVIPDNQWGFKPGKTTLENLAILHEKAHEACVERSILGVVFLDLSKAYDRVDRCQLIAKINECGYEGKLLDYLRNFLGRRNAYVQFKHAKSETKEIEFGVPQGSALSPELFNLYTAEMINHNENAEIIAFADDIAILKRGKTYEEVERKLNEEIKIIEKIAADKNLTFSSEKTKLMVFTRKRKQEDIVCWINGKRIKKTDGWKYLGIYFDEKLNFDEHIKNMTMKARKQFGYFRTYTNKITGITSDLALKIYKAHIRPILEYGTQIWGGTTESRLRKVDGIQHWCLTRLLGVPRRARQEEIRNFCKMKPLKTRRKEALRKYYEKKKFQDEILLLKNLATRRKMANKRTMNIRLAEEDEEEEIAKRRHARRKTLRNAGRRNTTTEERIENEQRDLVVKCIDTRDGWSKEVQKKWRTKKRRRIIEIVRNNALFGTLQLNDFQARMGRKIKRHCDVCKKKKETSTHFLFKCKNLKDIRLQYFGKKYILDPKKRVEILLEKESEVFLYWKEAMKRRECHKRRMVEKEKEKRVPSHSGVRGF